VWLAQCRRNAPIAAQSATRTDAAMRGNSDTKCGARLTAADGFGGTLLCVREAVAAAAVAALLLAAVPAAANGRYPAYSELLVSPGDSHFVVLRGTFGVVLSHDAGASWTWLCEEAFGLDPSAEEDPSLAVTGSNSLLAGIYGDLEVSPNAGCDWSAAPALAGRHVVDVTVSRASPHFALALASTYGTAPDGAPGYASQVYESPDDGATWSPLGVPFDPSLVVTSLEIAATGADPKLLYAVGFRLTATTVPILLVGANGGSAWAEHPMPPLSHEVSMYVAGVDPANAGGVYLRSAPATTAGQSRLFVTTDGGQTFHAALTLSSAMAGFALSPDGSTLYAGSVDDGLWVAARADAIVSTSAFHKTSAIHVQCLATSGADLWACSDEASGFVAGVSSDDGATFTPKLHLYGIGSAIACAPDSSASRCGAEFPQLCQALGGCDAATGQDAAAGPDAGEPSRDAGTGGSSQRASCGCSVVGGAGGAAGLAAMGGALAAVARRRRIRSAPRRRRSRFRSTG
jgi:hypothetical protein